MVNKLKCDPLKNNLLFFKVPDSEEETPNDCKSSIFHILQDKMKIDNARENIALASVERMGRFKSENTRPVVVKFEKFDDREKVRKSCSNLKNTAIGVAPHFPKDIADKRKALRGAFKKAKDEKKKAYFRYDKLFINDVEFVPGPQA
ncbi:uncharacterized protein LOC132738751 [Ruditapes philippinarum]|uniref:uncharacterized protein LOC132738751 n=1 Tax=Ruditapes philippinarum TaxID=129788 RepID=UPI00295BC222|nr:uncharacterized protein LOC132738751 [Ruditapes philippinarum]